MHKMYVVYGKGVEMGVGVRVERELKLKLKYPSCLHCVLKRVAFYANGGFTCLLS